MFKSRVMMCDVSDLEEAVPWLDAAQLEEWKSLIGLVSTLPTALEAQLKRDAGINLFEYHILVFLAEAPAGTEQMSRLAEVTQGSLSRLSHAITRLERAGWVRRRACGGAGRRTEAILTEAGREKLVETAPGHVREARRLVVDTLTPSQLAALGEAARAIVAVTEPVTARCIEAQVEQC